mgnify:FL=1
MVTMNEIYKVEAGYPISMNRKKLWDIELGILRDIDVVCKENSLEYFLHAGAGIGAARHHGFIPWDDDLDIGMARDSFERFIQLFSKKYQDKYSIQYGYGQYEECGTFLRIRDRNSTAIVKNQWNDKKRCHGVFVEIYPFDCSVDDASLREKQAKRVELYERVLNHRFSGKKFSGVKGILDRIFELTISTEFIWDLWNKECQRYNKDNAVWCDTPACPKYFREGIHHYKIQDVFPPTDTMFEGESFPVPANNDAVLKVEYGDYMKLPPVDQRGKNHDRIVFFDPNRCYLEYLDSDVPDRYFAGELDELL